VVCKLPEKKSPLKIPSLQNNFYCYDVIRTVCASRSDSKTLDLLLFSRSSDFARYNPGSAGSHKSKTLKGTALNQNFFRFKTQSVLSELSQF
jgi:hypothetical protein